MKRKKSSKRKPPAGSSSAPKSIYNLIGISGEVLSNEPKIVITGDYLIEIYNHKGIVDLSEAQIQVNTKKFIYQIKGEGLMIATVTDDELVVSGNMISVEKI